MAKRRATISFCNEAWLKIEALAEAKNISFAQATNEMVLRTSDAFQIEVANLLHQSEQTVKQTGKLEVNTSTIIDILTGIYSGVEILKKQTRQGGNTQ
jgi:hypothetical protein